MGPSPCSVYALVPSFFDGRPGYSGHVRWTRHDLLCCLARRSRVIESVILSLYCSPWIPSMLLSPPHSVNPPQRWIWCTRHYSLTSAYPLPIFPTESHHILRLVTIPASASQLHCTGFHTSSRHSLPLQSPIAIKLHSLGRR